MQCKAMVEFVKYRGLVAKDGSQVQNVIEDAGQTPRGPADLKSCLNADSTSGCKLPRGLVLLHFKGLELH